MLTRVLALAAGAACVFAFAPFGWAPVTIAALSAAVRAVGGRADGARRRGARIRVRVRPVRRRRVVGVRRARDVRRHARAGRRGRDGRLRRVPRAVARARRLGRRALHAAAFGRAPRRGGRCVDARRVAARVRVLGLPVAGDGLRRAPARRRAAARRLRAGGRRVPGVARGRALRGGAPPASWPRSRRRNPAASSRCLAGITRDRGRRRGADAHRVDDASRRAGRDLADPGQRVAGAEVRSGVPPAQLRALRHARHAEPRPDRRAAGERVSAVRRRDSRQRVPAPGRRRPRARRRRHRRPLHRGAAGGPRRRRAHLQQRREPRRRGAAALPEAPPRAVRRDDPAQDVHRLVHQLRAGDSAGRPGGGTRVPAAVRGRGSETRRQHLLRGRLRRGAARRRARVDAARQRHERRVVRPLGRRAAAQPDLRDPRAGDRAPDAARDQHRHHVRDRARRPRAGRAPVVHAGHPRDRDRRTRRRHALPALRRRARRGAGVRAAARGRSRWRAGARAPRSGAPAA